MSVSEIERPDISGERAPELMEPLFNEIPVGLAVYDRHFGLLQFNPTWAAFIERYTRTPRDRIVPGRSLFDLAPGTEDESRPLLEQAFAGETVRREALRLESEGITSYWDLTLTPLRQHGEVIAIAEVAIDATGRVLAYEAMAQRVEERTREIERRRKMAESLRETLAVLNSNHPLEETLDYIVAQAAQLLGTGTAAIFRLKPEQQLLTVQAYRGLSSAYAENVAIPVGLGAIGQAVVARKPVAISDTRTGLVPLLRDEGTGLQPRTRELLLDMVRHYRAVLAVPLVVKDQEVYGGITLYYRKRRTFSKDDIELAAMFGDQAALAIENARLRQRAEQTAVAAERTRLARDLHDSVTQTLFSASIIADVLPRIVDRDIQEAQRRIEEMRELVKGALAEMRMLLLELRPAALTEVGLNELLRQLAEATTGRGRIPVEVTIEGQCALPPDTQIALYRIAQEALNNVARHSGAAGASVALRCRAEGGELRITDDGRGFDASLILPHHLGLNIMRERAVDIGATLRIESRQGGGTSITVSWVRDREAPHERKPRHGE